MVQEWPQKDKLPPAMQTHWDSVILWWVNVALAYWQLIWKREIHYRSASVYWPLQTFWRKRSEISEISHPQQDICRKKKKKTWSFMPVLIIRYKNVYLSTFYKNIPFFFYSNPNPTTFIFKLSTQLSLPFIFTLTMTCDLVDWTTTWPDPHWPPWLVSVHLVVN